MDTTRTVSSLHLFLLASNPLLKSITGIAKKAAQKSFEDNHCIQFLLTENKHDKNEHGHHSVRVMNNVSDHHLHHEWQ
jgi:hypothetical protein